MPGDFVIRPFLMTNRAKMCYLVTKDENKHGSFALKTVHGPHLVELKREMNEAVRGMGVQLVTISRPTAYGEYVPYVFAKDEDEFREMVRSM